MSHVSPNISEEGSFIYEAEEWLLSKGGTIPDERKFPCMFQGMQDDYMNSGEEK